MLVIARVLWEKQKLAKNATGDASGMGATHSVGPAKSSAHT
ncbi:hypothetical protein [Paenibacillus sp. NPDC055715]